MLAKGPAHFQILSCYFIDVRLTTLCRIYLKLNKYKNKIKKGKSNVHLNETIIYLKMLG